MKEIPLTQGQVTLVDDEDYDELSKYKWYANWHLRTRSFYAVRATPRINGKQKFIKMHRAIMSAQEGQQVDHIDHDTLNNQHKNLRICNGRDNSRNQRKRRNSNSRFKGVSWQKTGENCGKWRTSIRTDGKHISLGMYCNEEEAARVYDAEIIKYYGVFANLNFPEEQHESGLDR